MKNIEEIQAELRERQIPVWLSSDHRRMRWHTSSYREQRRRYHQDQHPVATGRMCSHHDCTQMEIVLNGPTIARRSKANLMLRMWLLSSLRKRSNSEARSRSTVFQYVGTSLQLPAMTFHTSQTGLAPLDRQLAPSPSETVPENSVDTPNEIDPPKVWSLGAKQCM